MSTPRTGLSGGLVLLALVVASACGDDREPEELEVRPTPVPAAARTASPPPPPPLPRRPDRIERAGGLVVEIHEHGDGRHEAAAGDRVTLHYSARLADGEEPVESTYATGIPFALTLGAGEVVRGLDRGLVGARAGDRLKLHLPAALAYGERGLGDVPPDADLVFDVHILRID